eukprot:982368-Pelagomonas_calceolata.AAC.1
MEKQAGSKASNSSSSSAGQQQSRTAAAGDSDEEEEEEVGEGQQQKGEYECKHCKKIMSGKNENRMKLHLINPS